MKKMVVIIGSILLVGVVLIGLWITRSPKLLDFRGKVESVEQLENRFVYTLTLFEEPATVTYTVIVDERTKVADNQGHPFPVEKIQVGDEMEGDYRVAKNGKEAKRIRVIHYERS